MRGKRMQPQLRFSEAQQRAIVEDYLESNSSKSAIWEKYTGRERGSYQIGRWIRKYGYEEFPKFVLNPLPMKEEAPNAEEGSKKLQQLKKRIAELEKQAKESELKAAAFSKMVDLAEKEFNIQIRKKYNTKPSKK
jgi:hypothetical protein